MLVKATLQQELVNIFTEMANDTGDQTVARQKYAAKIATAIDNYIRSAQVITTVNTVVTGTCSTGPVAGTGVGSVNTTLQ